MDDSSSGVQMKICNAENVGRCALIVLLLAGSGCAAAVPAAETVPGNDSGVVSGSGGAEVVLSTEESVILDILTRIQVEAGTPEVGAEALFADYAGQEVAFEKRLTGEELREAGAVYEMEVTYLGQPVAVAVEIVDTTPPSIEGVCDLSVDAGDSIAYRKNIELTDNANGDIELKVDSDEVNLDIPGIYTVYYTATDKCGNEASAQATVTVNAVLSPEEEELNAMVDAVIAKVTTSEMSQWEMAYALWVWCNSNIYYTSTSQHLDKESDGAYFGLTKKYGDCFIYYATYAVFLNRCGIANMKVSRINGPTNHYWNLVNTGSGWYHCDTSPRGAGAPFKCFMQTDAQLQAYVAAHSELHPNYFTFDGSLYPERGTEVVFGDAPPEETDGQSP